MTTAWEAEPPGSGLARVRGSCMRATAAVRLCTRPETISTMQLHPHGGKPNYAELAVDMRVATCATQQGCEYTWG